MVSLVVLRVHLTNQLEKELASKLKFNCIGKSKEMFSYLPALFSFLENVFEILARNYTLKLAK